jgi:hypothetical protein
MPCQCPIGAHHLDSPPLSNLTDWFIWYDQPIIETGERWITADACGPLLSGTHKALILIFLQDWDLWITRCVYLIATEFIIAWSVGDKSTSTMTATHYWPITDIDHAWHARYLSLWIKETQTMSINSTQTNGTKVHSQWPAIAYLAPGCLISIASVHHFYLLLKPWVR